MTRAMILSLLLGACGVTGAMSGRETSRVAYPNGLARFEFELRDGLPNGRGRAWYPNGALQSEGTYQDGARNGRFWFFTEDGELAYQAMFFNNSEVWRSSSPTEAPPAEWAAQLPDLSRPAQRAATRVEPDAEPRWARLDRTPQPYFSNLDRTSSLARLGLQVGVGDGTEVDFGSVIRLDAFLHYRFAKFGVYAQVSQSRLELPSGMDLSGHGSFELGGTYPRRLGTLGELSTRLGVLVPTGKDDSGTFLASAAGAAQRPADAAASIPSALAVRTGTSFTRTRDRLVLQVDAGIDWLLSTDERGFDALARINGGIGFGSRTGIVTFELDNSIRLGDPSKRLHALGLGGTVSLSRFWLSGCLSIAQTGDTSFSTSVGHDL